MSFGTALRAGLVALCLASGTALSPVPALAAGGSAPLQIVVTKDTQSLVVYDGDTIVATSRVSTGKAGHATPTGIFSVLEKRRMHHSNIYSNAPMPFMQRLTWSGIALHASNSVPSYPASHGCVRLPNAFAPELYKMTTRGVHVIISDRQVVPSEISDPWLFQPEKPAPQLLSDATLRLGMEHTGSVEVAMIAPSAGAEAAKVAAETDEPPIRMLITRRGERETTAALQAALHGLGYDAGAADGVVGPKTRAAIRLFQGRQGMVVTGKISDQLVHAVYVAAGRPEPGNAHLMVRQKFAPLFDVPVTIRNPEVALGTHFLQFQDIDGKSGKGRWFGVTMDDALSTATKARLGITADAEPNTTLTQTLARIDIPADIRARIDALLAEGSSLTISDTGLGPETGKGTDFVTLTRSATKG
ncbi:Putative peptidoglycan binding domain-containing protein [Rhizobium sp. RU20A]|uniref:L,D-transpeptidase family protein n=1 Tax=Rhizobium sp. RU20A TaxID=1907412 RepID=UPI000955CED4|nr:L,D-transpeptidase family protein [Rhizobium sp. RU20A]SIP97829.1 Putative peptidoglycan binding domain-containing protein [Rhizobium sp. RU20A]